MLTQKKKKKLFHTHFCNKGRAINVDRKTIKLLLENFNLKSNTVPLYEKTRPENYFFMMAGLATSKKFYALNTFNNINENCSTRSGQSTRRQSFKVGKDRYC